jgi:LacI family transcriptional regulator, galactose operon repressor
MIGARKLAANGLGGAKRVTMAQVAAAANVSVPTVSKVLNGRFDVAVDTRRRVEAVIHTSGYARNRRKGPVKTRNRYLIDLVFSEFGPYATEIIKGAEEMALLNQCRITVSALSNDPKETRWLDNLGLSGSDGVVLVFAELSPAHRKQLKALNVPIVIVDPVGHPDPSTPSVGVTNWAGGMTATEHLIELGHRRIGLIAGRPAMLCNQARLDGYRAALNRAGIGVDPALIFTGAHHHPTALMAASAMLELPDPPTAIFATNDIHAMGVYEAARLHGLRLPDALSVVGFDDIPMAEWVSPPLTTMRQPLAEMAALAIQMLLGKEGSDLSHRMELATSLVIRSSTGPPSARASSGPAQND